MESGWCRFAEIFRKIFLERRNSAIPFLIEWGSGDLRCLEPLQSLRLEGFCHLSGSFETFRPVFLLFSCGFWNFLSTFLWFCVVFLIISGTFYAFRLTLMSFLEFPVEFLVCSPFFWIVSNTLDVLD